MGYFSNLVKYDGKDKAGLAIRTSSQITRARITAGLSQKKLAKKMGTKQSSISRAEGGSTLPSLSFLQKMAEALGTYIIEPKFATVAEREQAIKNQESLNKEIRFFFGRDGFLQTEKVASGTRETDRNRKLETV